MSDHTKDIVAAMNRANTWGIDDANRLAARRFDQMLSAAPRAGENLTVDQVRSVADQARAQAGIFWALLATKAIEPVDPAQPNPTASLEAADTSQDTEHPPTLPAQEGGKPPPQLMTPTQDP